MKKVLLFFWLISTLTANAQQEFLRGKLLDAVTEEPIAFATIQVKGKYKGVVSNQDGSFRIPRTFSTYGDTLEISSMGYREMEWRISQLTPVTISIIRLQPNIFELREAVVSAKKKKGLNAKQIVRRAIRNITDNYPQHTFSTIGYYRDYQKDEEEYANLNEAILEVFDEGFDTSDSAETKVRLFDFSRNTDFKQDERSSVLYNYTNYSKTIDNAYLSDYGGNEFTILRVHNAVRNHDVNSYSFVNRFESDLLRHHKFSKDMDTYWNGESLYTIRFKNTHPKYTANGTLYISREDFGIIKLEYVVYDENRFDSYGEAQNLDKDRKLIFKIDTEYRRAYDKLYLNYISFHNTFRIALPPLFQIKDITIDLAKQVFVIYFNNDIMESTASSLENYQFKYRNTKIVFSEAKAKGDKIFLNFQLGSKQRAKMFAEVNDIFVTEQQENVHEKVSDILATKVEGVKDVEGNLVNEIRYKEYNQFREFFVQELKPKTRVPTDTLFMKKNRPIFDNQPIIKPTNLQEYWMNTPLQTEKD